MCFCHKEQLRVLRNQNSSRLAGIECLYGNLSSRLDEIPATDAGRSRQLIPGSRLGEMKAGSYKHSIEFILQARSRQLSRPA